MLPSDFSAKPTPIFNIKLYFYKINCLLFSGSTLIECFIEAFSSRNDIRYIERYQN